MSSHLQRIWIVVQEYAKIVRSNEMEECDGKKHWNKIKEFIQLNIKGNIDNCEFIKLENKKTQQIMELPEYEVNNSDIEIIEMNHFMIQTVKIPNENIFSVIKLLQISFNIGQFLGMDGNLEHLARSKIEEFISAEDIQKINMANAYA